MASTMDKGFSHRSIGGTFKSDLRMLLPVGNPSDPNKWTVYHLLEMAGLGKVVIDKKDPKFIPNDPKIKVYYLRPSDIPYELENDCADIGVTGEDCIYESYIYETPDLINQYRVLDLRCGCVDWCFCSTSNRVRQAKNELVRLLVQKRFKKVKGEFKDLELIILSNIASSYYTSCRSEKRNMAENELFSIFETLKGKKFTPLEGLENFDDFLYMSEEEVLSVLDSHGQTERYLHREDTDMIFESVATGDSLSKRGGIILSKARSSSMGLYIEPKLSAFFIDGHLGGTDNLPFKFKVEKTRHIRNKLEAVLKEIDDLCQVSFTLQGKDEDGMVSDFSFTSESGFVEQFSPRKIFDYLFNFSNTPVQKDPQRSVSPEFIRISKQKGYSGVEFVPDVSHLHLAGPSPSNFPSISNPKHSHIIPSSRRDFVPIGTRGGFYFTMPKKLLAELCKDNPDNPEKSFTEKLNVPGYECKIFDLASLYKYCPFFSTRGSSYIQLEYDQVFAPVQSHKLRREHYDDALIASSEDGFKINLKYKYLSEGGEK